MAFLRKGNFSNHSEAERELVTQHLLAMNDLNIYIYIYRILC